MLTKLRSALRYVFESATAAPAAINAPPAEGIAVQEYASSAGASLAIDRDAHVIRGVKVIGVESRNGRRYPAAVLEAAIGKYESAKVNVGHAVRVTAPRDYHDRLGVIKNVRRGHDGLYGDLHYNPKHAVAEQLAWDAEHNPAAVGLSPAHICRFRMERGVEVAEAVARVISVDLVGDPATTRGLFEETAGDESVENQPSAADNALPALTLESLAADHPQLLDELRGSLAAELSATLAAEQIAVAEAATSKIRVNVAAALKALMASQLPYNAWDNGMLDAIVVAESAAAAEQLVTSRVALVKQISEQLKTAAPPSSGPKSTPKSTAPPSGVLDAKTFARRLKA